MAPRQDTPLPELRRRLELMHSQLQTERSHHEGDWKELGKFILPHRIRFDLSETNRQSKRTNDIVDSTASFACRTTSAGMQSGVTSPARPWFRLTTPDAELADLAPVREWLHTVTQRMAAVFLKSNLYNRTPTLYGDIAVFGTAAMMLVEDDEDVVRFIDFPIGSYWLGLDKRLKVRVFVREVRMTVRQVVETWGLGNVSPAVRAMHEAGTLEQPVDVVHAIFPNPDHDPSSILPRHFKYRAVYWEKANREKEFLEDSGFEEWPLLTPRWETVGTDVYGTWSPGMVARGDIKQLQHGEKRALQLLDKHVNPPMVGPTTLKGRKASILPGDITYVDVTQQGQGFTPAHQVSLRLEDLEFKQEQVRQRIRRAFYEDLFLMLANTDRREITAREIEERHEEKLLALGPVLEQLNQDLLDPLIDRTFAIMLRRGLLPPPPPEMEGVELKVEYISIMAQAQKMVGLGSLERFSAYLTNLAQVDPSVLDKGDLDEMVEEYAEITGVSPKIVRADEDVQAIREERARIAEQQAQAEQMAQMAPAAQALAETPAVQDSPENLLSQLLGAGAPGGPL